MPENSARLLLERIARIDGSPVVCALMFARTSACQLAYFRLSFTSISTFVARHFPDPFTFPLDLPAHRGFVRGA
jgi:hypothetical protein